MLRSNPSAGPGVVTDGPRRTDSGGGFVSQSIIDAKWEVVAQATGPRGTTLAILAEHPDGTVRLRDRCAEGLTPDGTAIDEIYADRLTAMWDAVRLVGVWVGSPSGQPSCDNPARGSLDVLEFRNLGEGAYTLTPGATVRKVSTGRASSEKREGANGGCWKNSDGSPERHFPSGLRVYTWGEHEVADALWYSAP
jgi:hypothetical protein